MGSRAAGAERMARNIAISFGGGKTGFMYATRKPLPKGLLIAALCCLMSLTLPGCTTYFRTGEMSNGEIEQRQRETQEITNFLFKPGTHFY